MNNINSNKKVCAVIAAAGKSTRMGFENGISKQFIEIDGKTVIEKTVTVFDLCSYIDEIIIVSRFEDIDKIKKIIENAGLKKVVNIIAGGETRKESVSKAVEKIGEHIDFIAIHDGARCFITCGDIIKVISKAFETGAAAAGTKVTDTIKLADNNNNIIKTIDRNLLWAVQTPQVFSRNLYLSALKLCERDVTDDCAVIENTGHILSIVECSKYNIKITDSQDLNFFNSNRGIKRI